MSQKLYDSAYLERLLVFFGDLKRHSHELLSPEPGQTVADVGCGTGDDARQLAESGATVIGIDHDPAMIDIARQQPPLVQFLTAEAHALPLADASLDAIRFDRIFQHVPNHDAVLQEAWRVLKPGGKIQIIDPDYQSMTLFMENIALERRIMDAVAQQRIPNAYKIRRLPGLLGKTGFEVQCQVVHTYQTFDQDFAFSVVRFREQVTKMHQEGAITAGEYQQWQAHILRPNEQFAMTFNVLLLMGVKC